MKININSIEDWEELEELPEKEKIQKKKKPKKEESLGENSNEIDIYKDKREK